MSDNHSNYDHSHGGDRDSQSMNPEQGNNKSMSRINDKSQGNSGTVSPRNQDRHQQVSTNSSLSSAVNISSGVGVVPYHYSVNVSSGQQGGNVPEFVPRGASGMHYDGQGQGQGQGIVQSQGPGLQGGLGPSQQGGGGQGQGQGYPQQPQHYQPYVAYPPNQVIGYGQQPHHPYHPQMVSGVRQLPTQQLQQQPHYQPHPGVVQGHEMNMMHPQQQQQLQQQQQQHHTTRNRVEERGGGGGGDNYQNYNNNNARNMPVAMPAFAPNGIPIPYRGNMSASISDYPYDATYGANPIVNQVGGYYTAVSVPVQGVMMSTGSTTGTGDVPVMIPIAANTTLENMTNERLMALAKSNEQHKVVSEMLLKTAQSDLANSRKKVEELTAQLDEVRRELTAEKAINESRKIVEYQIAAVSGSLNQTDLSANQKEMARGSEEYGAEKQEERLKASINLNRDWERDVDEGSANKTVYVKKDSNLEKDKSTSGRPTDSAATILVKSVLLSPRSPAVASNAEPVKIPAVSQRTWADADDEEEDESKAPVSAQGPGQGQRAQGGVYSRGPGQGHGEGPSRGGGSTDGSTYKSGRDKESTGQYGAGRGSKAGQPYNSYDGDRNRGFDRDNRESSYGGDHHSSFGGRGSGEGRGQFGGRGMNNMGGRGQADRGSIGSGAGNVVRPLRPTKIIPPAGGPFPSSPSKPPVEQERERERDGQDSAHGGGSPGIPRSINGTGATNNNDSSSSSSGKKLNSNPTSDVRNTKSLIFGGPPNPNPTFTRSTTSTFGSRDVRVLDAANAANASANANANTNANANATSSYSNTNSNFESPTRRKGPPAQFISTSPDRENSNTNSNSRFGDSSDEHADTEGNGEERAGSTDEGNMKNNAAMKSKKGIKNLRPAGRDGGRGDGWRGSGIGGRGRGRDDERRSLGGHEGSGGRGEAMKIPPPPYLAAYHRDKDNDSSATTGQSSGAGTSATETDRERGDSMRSSSATAGVNMDGSVCRFYSKGFCRFGADCNNLHTGPVVKSLNRPRADSAPEGDTEPDDASGRRMESDRREKGAQPGRGWGGREGGGRDAGRESKGRGRGGRRPHTASFDGSSSDVTPQTATNINITDAPVQSSTRSDIAANVDAMSIVSTSTVENASVGKGKSISTVVVAAAVAVAAKETVVISE